MVLITFIFNSQRFFIKINCSCDRVGYWSTNWYSWAGMTCSYCNLAMACLVWFTLSSNLVALSFIFFFSRLTLSIGIITYVLCNRTYRLSSRRASFFSPRNAKFRLPNLLNLSEFNSAVNDNNRCRLWWYQYLWWK